MHRQRRMNLSNMVFVILLNGFHNFSQDGWLRLAIECPCASVMQNILRRLRVVNLNPPDFSRDPIMLKGYSDDKGKSIFF